VVRPSDDRDLEVIPIGHDIDADGLQPPKPSTSSWKVRRVRRAVLVTALVASAGLAAVALVVSHHATSATAHRPTAAEINARVSVQRSQVVVAVGDKIIVRPISGTNGTGPIGLLRLAPRPAGVLAVDGRMVVAQGTDESGDGRAGTWAYPVDAQGRAVFLGASTAFVPEFSQEAWLVTGTAIRGVSVATGVTVDGPLTVDGRLVAPIGAGLLLQRGAEVVWWIPGGVGVSRLVGTGTALGGLGDYILWRASDGRITITDPNIGQATPTALTVPPGETPGPAAMSPDRVRVAVAVGSTVVIGGSTRAGHVVRIRLGPVENLAWLDDQTLVVSVGDRGLVVVDGASGVIAHEPDFPVAPRGLALFQPSTG
jgi:hypothetical protein